MDLELYYQLFKRFWVVFAAIFLGTIVLTWGVLATKPPVHEGTVMLSVIQKDVSATSSTPYYQFGEYYGLQGSNFLADYVVALLRDPALVVQILNQAQSGVPDASLARIGRIFDVKSVGTIGVQLNFQAGSNEETERVLTTAVQTVQSNFTSLQSEGFYPNVKLQAGAAYVKDTRPDLVLSLVIAGLAGIVLGMIVLTLLSPSIASKRRE